MRKIKLYIAMSLNGRIAEKNGSVEWLESIPNPEKLDYGYSEFYKNTDTTIQGFSTYNQIIEWGIPFPYAEKKNYVLTRKQDLENTKHVEFVSENHIEFIKNLKSQEGGNIWLIGGGQINTLLLNARLIDEINVFIMPIILNDGIELFESIPNKTRLEVIESKSFSSGCTEIKYKVL